MKKTTLIFLFFFGFNFISNAQFKYADEFPVNFDIDNVTLGVDKNVVNVSGGTPDGKWVVKMTWTFTNFYDTEDTLSLIHISEPTRPY